MGDSPGDSPEDGERKKERLNDGENNGQATHGARKHAWCTQAKIQTSVRQSDYPGIYALTIVKTDFHSSLFFLR